MICGMILFILGIWCWVHFFTRFPERTVRDVYPFLRFVEAELLNGAFHPEPEEKFRAANSLSEFRKWQEKRIHLAIRLCLDISENSRVLGSWARHERKHNWMAFPHKVREGMREFLVSCMHSRTAAFAVRFRLRLWLIRMNMLPFLPVPTFRTLAEHSNTLINFYGTAETLAEVLSRIYGEDIHENMLAVLGMVDVELDGLEEQG